MVISFLTILIIEVSDMIGGSRLVMMIIGTKAREKQDIKRQDEVYSGFANDGQIKAKKVWRLGGKTGINAKLVTSGGAYVHYRVIVVDDTILQAMVIGNKKFAPQEKADKFFNNLELLD